MSSMSEQRLQEALAKLPWLERSCLLLSINTDFTQEEIASILHVTDEEVGAALLRGREQFHHAYYHISKAKEELNEQISYQDVKVAKPYLVADIPIVKSQEHTVRESISNGDVSLNRDDIAPEVVSIADACLGGLQGRSALLIGPKEQRCHYEQLLRRAHIKKIFQEETPTYVSALLPHVQLVISMPLPFQRSQEAGGSIPVAAPTLTAAIIARGCERRRTPLLIFDLDPLSSVEELAGLLPSVCLYTPEDLRRIIVPKAKTTETVYVKLAAMARGA